MTTTTSPELDVRAVPKPQRHPLIFDRFAALPRGDSFILVNNHDPKHLRQEFDRDHPGTYGWDYLESGPIWRIQITKRTVADLPRIVGDTNDMPAAVDPGAVWKLDMSTRHLDANIIDLEPNGQIASHAGPDLDVLLYVIDGTGRLATEADDLALSAGTLVWLPRRSGRSFSAGPEGLRYLTVHPKRPGLRIENAPAADPD